MQKCFQTQCYEEALTILRQCLSRGQDWNSLYLTGQACRFLGQLDEAERYLKSAVALEEQHAPVLAALGIVCQLKENYDEAVAWLERAVELDPGFEPALNSLALTYKKIGRFKDALKNYERAMTAFFRRLVLKLHNSEDNPILPHRDTAGKLWAEKACEMMIFLAASIAGIDKVAWATGKEAEREERTGINRGLLYKQVVDSSNQQVLYFLPNYFNTVRERLREESTYAILLNNMGSVLAKMGRCGEARQYFEEAIEFTPAGVRYNDPHEGLRALADGSGDSRPGGVSSSDAAKIAAAYFKHTHATDCDASQLEVIPGSTSDSPYAAYKNIIEPCNACWIVAWPYGLGTALDGPVTLVWVSRQSGKIVATGSGQSGG